MDAAALASRLSTDKYRIAGKKETAGDSRRFE